MSKLKTIVSNLKKKSKYLYLTAVAAGMAAITNVSFVYAADNKYATNASNWMMSGIQSIATVGAVFIVSKCLISRKFVQMLVSILIAAVILAIVYNPSIMRGIGDYIANTVIG